MDAAAATRPSGHGISAETTALNQVPLPHGQPSQLVLHLAVTETHEWFGIGGRSGHLRRPRLLTSRDVRLTLPTSCPDFRRRLIVWTIMHELRDQSRGLSAAGVEAGIAERARALPADDGACVCEVSTRVGVEFVYSEAAALLWACANNAGDMNRIWRSASGGDGAAPPCSICLEEMAAAEEIRLPGCAHGFHRRCIGRWFEKASTCPVCRRDKLRFLPPDYTAVRDMMLSDPEGSC
ncbi:unnamed protein product [Urochloa decumbens]|uniref:RING-type E3 ubiquitin transferase n=1 Tax=Urochloa decumbens TaxID=240449 RepID=A0ABC8Z367_9POAL